MDFMIGIAVFLFIVWLTASICARKGHSIWLGLAVGALLQPLGRLIALGLSIGAAGFGRGPAEWSVLLMPFVILLGGAILPVTVAVLLPRTADAEPDLRPNCSDTAMCVQCGRLNAVTTAVCPRCGTRTLAGKANPPQSQDGSSSGGSGSEAVAK